MFMETRMTYFGIFLVLAVVGLRGGVDATVTCYECQGVGGSACGDPFPKPSNVSTCTGTMCVKEKTSASVVTRRCSEEVTGTNCQEEAQKGALIKSCTCNTNHCNTGSHVTHFTPAVIICTLASIAARLF